MKVYLGKAKQWAGALVLVCSLGQLGPAAALSINLNFTGGLAPGNTAGGGQISDIFRAAADWWEMSIADNHVVNVDFGWGALGSGTLGQAIMPVVGPPASGGSILMNNDGSTAWFMDMTPHLNEEYSTFTSSSLDLGGGVINVGRVYDGALGDAVGRFDLLSVAKHELGHTLGLFSNGANGKWDNPLVITAPRPKAATLVPTANLGGGHIAISTSLMFPFFSSGMRKVQSEVDILAVAELNNWVNLNTDAHPVPEPSSLVLMGLGLVGLAVRRRV